MLKKEMTKEQEALCALYTYAPTAVLVANQDFEILWSNNCFDNTFGGNVPKRLPVDFNVAKLSKKLQEQPDAVFDYIGNDIYDIRITPTLLDEQGEPQAYVVYVTEHDTMRQRENFITAPRVASASLNRFRFTVDSMFSSLLTLSSRTRFAEDYYAYDNLRKMNSDCFAMLRDTQNLKIYSSMLSGDSETDMSTVDIVDHMNQMCSALNILMQNRFADREFTFEYNLPKEPIAVNLNRELLDVALMNIISNSFLYSYLPEEPFALKIDVSQIGEDVRIHILDNGPGMPPEMMERIYNPFYSFDQTGEEIPRLGLGLTVTKSVVEFFGGYILTTSLDGDGMDITIILPTSKVNLPANTLHSELVSSEYTNSYFSRYSPLHVYLCDSINPPMP